MQTGSDVLGDVEAFLRRYVVLGDAEVTALVLWVAHTYAVAFADATPYIHVHSPEKASGKTRVLEALEHVVSNPWIAASTTPAALYRKIDKDSPTLLLDEVDAIFNGDREKSEALRGILNAGYRRGGKATVCVGKGGDMDTKDYSAFCPKALCGLGHLPDTLASRCIPIKMQRRRADEPVHRLRYRDAQAAGEPIRDALDEWLVGAVDVLEAARPAIPDELPDRAADVWEPLLALADHAGGDWPDRARRAARTLTIGGLDEDGDSFGVRLLRDVRAVFGDDEHVFTADLLDRLRNLDEAPWGDLKGKPLASRDLARRLKQYGVTSRTVRVGEKTAKGYARDSFADPWSRYLDPPVTPCDVPCDGSNPSNDAGCDVVTLVPGGCPGCGEPIPGEGYRHPVTGVTYHSGNCAYEADPWA